MIAPGQSPSSPRHGPDAALWLSWLAAEAPAALVEPSEKRITPERIKGYAQVLANTMKPASVASYVGWLLQACGHMWPSTDWSWLRQVKTRLQARAPNRPHEALPFDNVALQDVGQKLMEEGEAKLGDLCDADEGKRRESAELYRMDSSLGCSR